MNSAIYVIEQYKKGQRYFVDLNMENGIFDDENLEGIIFEKCYLYSSFQRANLRNAKFINCNIKTCDFTKADLTNTHFEYNLVCGAAFTKAKIDGTHFDNNESYGQKVTRAALEDWVKD